MVLSSQRSAEDGGGKNVEAAAAAYRLQHEPVGSSSWNAECMRVLAAGSRLHLVTGSQCSWKPKAPTSCGNSDNIWKKTAWMTSSPVLAQALESSAYPQYSHRHLVQQHTALASIFLLKLVVAVLKALCEQLVLDGATNREEVAFAGPVPDEGDAMNNSGALGASTTSGSLQHCSQQDARRRWST